MGIIKGIVSSSNPVQKNVTTSETGDKVGLDVTIIGGASDTGGNNTQATGSILYGIEYDAVDIDESAATQDVYQYYVGGLAGTLVATVTITYTDSTKESQDSIVRTTP